MSDLYFRELSMKKQLKTMLEKSPFLSGIVKIIDFGSYSRRYRIQENDLQHASSSDWESISEDWKNVGRDLSTSFDKFSKQCPSVSTK